MKECIVSGITTCLWFDTEAEEAAKFYVATLRDGKLGEIARYKKSGAEVSGQPEGSVMTASWEVEGQKFMGLNGGPAFTFSEAVSFVIKRDNQEDLDAVWNALIADGGSESQCGWCKDKFGVSWQVIPAQLPDLMTSEDPGVSNRVMSALMEMTKIDIGALERAKAGETAGTR
jgi:predicted 3-demethylubiquinone-9 3-methyltransferase (glyoxalase superfamily)